MTINHGMHPQTEEVYSARFEHRFEVSPSLEFRYATRPSSNQRHPFVLNLEVRVLLFKRRGVSI